MVVRLSPSTTKTALLRSHALMQRWSRMLSVEMSCFSLSGLFEAPRTRPLRTFCFIWCGELEPAVVRTDWVGTLGTRDRLSRSLPAAVFQSSTPVAESQGPLFPLSKLASGVLPFHRGCVCCRPN
jgi:hypothetical protein